MHIRKKTLFWLLTILTTMTVDCVIFRNKSARKIVVSVNDYSKVFQDVTWIKPWESTLSANFTAVFSALMDSPSVKYAEFPNTYYVRFTLEQEILEALHQLPLEEIVITDSDNPQKPKLIVPDLKTLQEKIRKKHQEEVKPKLEEALSEIPKSVRGIIAEYCSPEENPKK